MPCTIVLEKYLVTNANGTATGTLGFASTADFVPGLEFNLCKADDTLPVACECVEVTSSTVIKARIASSVPKYGLSDFSAYLSGAKVNIPHQVVYKNT